MALGLLILAAPASAGKSFDFGFADDRFSDDLFTNESAAVRSKYLGLAADANATYARINVYWSSVAFTPPANPTDPSDPAYDFAEIDRAVKSANEQGLEVVLLVLNAPTWAEAPGRHADLRPGTWKPSPDALRGFAEALARRYSGSYPDPAGGSLPGVKYYEAWNEPNLRNYLNPLWEVRKPASPEVYRGLLNGFYAGIKAASSANRVITGGTSPFGEKPGGRRMRPLLFWREVFCLNRKLKKKCNESVNFDIFGHNGINSPGDPPSKEARHKDDATVSDFDDLGNILRAAEKWGTAKGAQRHQMWSTETWYESKPPQRRALSLKGQANAMQDSMYLLWRQKVSAVIFLQVRDSPYDPNTHALLGFQTGIYFVNNKPKPAVDAVRFPFVADRKGKKTVLWTIPPDKGKVKFELKQGGGFNKVAAKRGKPGTVIKLTEKLPKKAKLRAKQGKRTSLVYKSK